MIQGICSTVVLLIFSAVGGDCNQKYVSKSTIQLGLVFLSTESSILTTIQSCVCVFSASSFPSKFLSLPSEVSSKLYVQYCPPALVMSSLFFSTLCLTFDVLYKLGLEKYSVENAIGTLVLISSYIWEPSLLSYQVRFFTNESLKARISYEWQSES